MSGGGCSEQDIGRKKKPIDQRSIGFGSEETLALSAKRSFAAMKLLHYYFTTTTGTKLLEAPARTTTLYAPAARADVLNGVTCEPGATTP